MHFRNKLRWLAQSVFLSLFFCLLSLPAQAMTDAEINKLFDDALEESESGDVANAIALFETILSERPDMNRVRMELALANFRSLNYALARRLGEQVLSDPSTPEPVKETIRQFLSEVEDQSQSHLWTPFISIGYIHDDNINVGPSSSVVDIGGATLLLGASAVPRSSSGVQVNAGLAHRYLFPSSYNILGESTALAWQSQASLFRNQYFGNNNFSLNVITLRTGPTLLAARKWRLTLTGEANHIEIGNKQVGWYAGVSPSFTWIFNSRTALTATFLAQDRNFTQSTSQDRDALFLSTGLSLGHTFRFDWDPTVRIGGTIFTENAQTNRRSNEGFAVNAGFNISPIRRGDLYFNYSWRTRNYDGPEPFFAVTRDEINRRYTIGGSYRLDAGQYLDDLVLSLSWTRTENNSNVSIFEYTRNQALFNVSKSF